MRYGAKVFCDIGPVQESETGQAEDAYLEAARAFLQLGGTHFLFETQADFAPLKPAVEEIAETCPDAFVAVSFAVSQDGYSQKGLFYRTLIEQALGCPEVHMAGLNCVCGPVHMAELMLRLPETDKPLMALPNAGYPSQAGGRTFFQDNAAYFGEKLAQLSAARPVVVGGCCGTDPGYIRALAKAVRGLVPKKPDYAPAAAVCSHAETVVIDRVRPIGERINPTGKKRMKQALLAHEMEYLVSQGIEQVEAGAEILDVNVGLPGLDFQEYGGTGIGLFLSREIIEKHGGTIMVTSGKKKKGSTFVIQLPYVG